MGGLLAGRRVLVVEDRYLIAAEICEQVEQLGGALLGPFAGTAPALAALKRSGVDLALLDVNLNGTPVFPVAERLAALDVPFIFMTGYDGSTLPPQWRDRPRLGKPFDPRQLEAELLKLC